MIRIEVLVSLVAGILLFLAVSGSHCRRCRNWFFQKGVLGAYALSFSLARYTLGSMQSSELKSSIYPIWIISLFMLHACTDSITAYSLDDNRQVTRLEYQAVMYNLYVVLLFVTVQKDYIPSVAFISLIAFIRYLQRGTTIMLASRSWKLNKMVADYMYDDEKHNKDVFDPTTMERCNYLVDWPISKSKFVDAQTSYSGELTVEDPEEVEIIDIGKVWRCKSLGPELKDACLSISLFHLLRRRFFGFACDESKDRAHNFFFECLLLEKKLEGSTDYNRVFKVIEVELAFMYDFFFTKYATIYYGSMAATIWSLISVIGISIMAYFTARTPLKISQGDRQISSTVTDDVVITLVILGSTALLEFLQMLFFWMGIWGRVSFVCKYIREQARLKGTTSQRFLAKIGVCLASSIMVLKAFLANIGVSYASNRHYWQHKIGQYSLLDSVSCNPSRSILAILHLMCIY
ncbi:uncharacterized protein [Triticum aestivum]|uniref:uncharacterized protein n=1 Tax=Triticum aestivum TaxID=4565 RepID=UPI001D00A8B4|nr:uncharacterized protein LOC123126273 [Triticum aestivum]